MENYRDLAIRYVKYNKRRSILTAGGVAVAAAVLYIILNLAWSYLLNYRTEIRKDMDYEIVLFTESEAQISEIIADDRIKDATVGRYYVNDYNNPIDYENATYINVRNPYRIEKTLEYLKDRYGVEGTINTILAETYMQGDTGDVMYIGILIVIMVSYIFAIMGVGIIRNSIQLTMLERIKDFGNLRCIGSTKKQLKGIIFIQGAVIEGTGIIAGVILGWIGSLITGAVIGWNYVSFHFLPVVCVVVAFVFDLYFAMDENAKLVTGMTPVSAIRGEYRIKKEKKGKRTLRKIGAHDNGGLDGKKYAGYSKDNDLELGNIHTNSSDDENAGKKVSLKKNKKEKKIKPARSGIWGRIFGVAGNYAYKNLRRNPGRFRRTVAAMAAGIAATMLVFGITRSMLQISDDIKKLNGYYHVSAGAYVNPYDSKEEIMKNLPPQDMLTAMSALPGIEKAAQIKGNSVLVTDFEEYYSHWTEDYAESSSWLKMYRDNEEQLKGDKDWDILNAGFIAINASKIPCYGYDSEDLERYRQYLTDGTLNVSDNGIILVEGGYKYRYSEVSNKDYIDTAEYLDYKVGDTIEFVDMEEFRNRYNERLEPITKEYERHYKELSDEIDKLDRESAGVEGASSVQNEESSTYEPGNEENINGAADAGGTAEGNETALTDEEKRREEKQRLTDEQSECTKEYAGTKDKLLYDVYKEVIDEGYKEIYTVEGIVSADANFFSGGEPAIVLPMDKFYSITGTDDSWLYGMMYHFKHFPASAYERILMEYDVEENYLYSSYGGFMVLLNSFRNGLIVAALIVLFVVLMNIFNIINTTASDLYLRRKEFAQLRVIGISKKELYKMIMLEGVIQAMVSSLWGIIIGCGIGILVFEMIFGLMFAYHYVFPLAAAFISVIVTVLILCGAVYFPLKRMPNDVAAELATAGE